MFSALRQFFTSSASAKERFDPNAQLPSLENITQDSEVLLSYAATAGVALSAQDVTTLIAAHSTDKKELTLAYSRVAAALLPVTAFTLRKFFLSYRQTLRFYVILGTLLSIIVVFFSLLTLISSSLSDSLKTEIDLANSKALSLQTHLGTFQDQGTATATTPSQLSLLSTEQGAQRKIVNQLVPSSDYSTQDLLIDLQQFAISLRFIDSRSDELRRLVFFLHVLDPYKDIRHNPDLLHGKFELVSTATPTVNFLALLDTYQKVRAYAQNLRDGVTFWYGGVAASILPVLYAILGVCALSLRKMQVAIRDKTFADSSSKEHVLVAVIAGMLISLFSGLFVTSGVSLSPVALAFLAGYSSDAFFQVLEGVIRPRTRATPESPPGGRTSDP